MSVKLTYTTEDGTTFHNINQAKIHDAITQTGVYIEKYKISELVKELDKILVVEYRTSLGEAKTPVDIAVRSGVGVHTKEDYFERAQEDKTPVESSGLGFPSVRD